MATNAQPMQEQPHKLTMDNRKKLSLTGVKEVVSFDESNVLLHTCQGALMIRGENLHLQTLSLGSGQVEVTGLVSSLVYEQMKEHGSFLSRLFG